MKKKADHEQLTNLRRIRQNHLDKARECVVYGDADGYHFWINAANEISNKIMTLNFPDGPKTERRIEKGQLIISMRKKITA